MEKYERQAGPYKVIAEARDKRVHVEIESDPEHVLCFDIVPHWDAAETSAALYDLSGWGEDALWCISDAFARLAGLPDRCEHCYERHAPEGDCI